MGAAAKINDNGNSDTELLASLNDIAAKLDLLIGILAAQGKSTDEQIAILRGMGVDWRVVSSIAGINVAAAKKRLQRSSKTNGTSK